MFFLLIIGLLIMLNSLVWLDVGFVVFEDIVFLVEEWMVIVFVVMGYVCWCGIV